MVVSDNVSLNDVGQWEAIAAAVISAAAQGAGMAVQMKQQKKAEKAAAKQSQQDAAQAAAMFDQQLVAPQQGMPQQRPMPNPYGTPQRGMNVAAPIGPSTNWDKIIIIGGSAVVGLAVIGIVLHLTRG